LAASDQVCSDFREYQLGKALWVVAIGTERFGASSQHACIGTTVGHVNYLAAYYEVSVEPFAVVLDRYLSTAHSHIDLISSAWARSSPRR
jgi:hypothetical protein